MGEPDIILVPDLGGNVVVHLLEACVKHRVVARLGDAFQEDTAGAVNVGFVPSAMTRLVAISVLHIKRYRQCGLLAFEKPERVFEFALGACLAAGVGIEVCTPRHSSRLALSDVFLPAVIILRCDVFTESAADHYEIVSGAFDFCDVDASVVGRNIDALFTD